VTDPHTLAALAAEYDPQDGFLGLLARGRFDGARLERPRLPAQRLVGFSTPRP
jgi:hypothetical protein